MERLLLVCWNILMITCGVSTQSSQVTLDMTTFSPGCPVRMNSMTKGETIQKTSLWSINNDMVYGFYCDETNLKCFDNVKTTQTKFNVSGNAIASSPTAVNSTIFFTASKAQDLTIKMTDFGGTTKSNVLQATVQLCNEALQENGVSTPSSSCTSGHFGCEVVFKCRNGTVGSSITATCTCGATWDKFISCVSDGDGGKNTGLNAGAIIGIIIVIIIGVFFIQIIIGIRCIDGEGCKNRGPVIRCFCIGITIGICLKDKICKKPDQNDGTGKDKNKRKAKEGGRDDSPQGPLISKSVVEDKNVRTEKDEIELKLQDGDRNDSPQC